MKKEPVLCPICKRKLMEAEEKSARFTKVKRIDNSEEDYDYAIKCPKCHQIIGVRKTA